MSANPVLLCMGTRPEIIKMAPVFHALREASVPAAVLHTGQHQEMARPLYEFFGVQPDYSVDLRRRSDTLGHLTSVLMENLARILPEARPPVLLVHGDTSSALAGALSAFYLKIPVGHVEAGLRTRHRYDPFPEEKNRELIARLAHWHFAPTPQAQRNLKAEGIDEERIFMVGNTAVDATHWGMAHLDEFAEGHTGFLPENLKGLAQNLAGRRLVLVTAHRRENWGLGIETIAEAVRELVASEPELVLVWPVHANPMVSDTVGGVLDALPARERRRLYLCEPLSYPALLWVLRRCWLVMTDSGGIQEEAAALHKPVFVLRESTERPELIRSGGGILVGTNWAVIVSQVRKLWKDARRYESMCRTVNPFGDGKASRYIVEALVRELPNLAPRASTQD